MSAKKRSTSGKTGDTQYLTRPILLHGHESYVTTKRLDSRIQVADMKVIRLIKGVTRRDKIRNADIYEEFHIKPIIDVIREGTFRWLGRHEKRATLDAP